MCMYMYVCVCLCVCTVYVYVFVVSAYVYACVLFRLRSCPRVFCRIALYSACCLFGHMYALSLLDT